MIYNFDLKRSNSFKIILIFLLLLSLSSIVMSQSVRWFECKYFNQGTDIQYLHNPYLRLEASTSKARLLISADAFGITIYNSHGPSHFYKHNFIKYNLNNGKTIELHEGINGERQYYIMGITAPYGTKRNLYDSSIIIATNTKANLYGTVLLYDVKNKDQEVDNKLAVTIDSSIVLSSSDASKKSTLAKRILILDGKKLQIDQTQFDLQLIKGTPSSRHYVIEDDGTELIVKETENKFIISKSFVDGGIVRFYASRK